MADEKEYDAEYFETGVSSGKSGYQDYRWMPEITIKFAHKIIKELRLREDDKILDFGCAKGYLVKAFRILDIDAYGCDISQYAIKNVDLDVRDCCSIIEDGNIPHSNSFRWIIAKDVFEHLTGDELEKTLKECASKSENLFAVIPLGDGEKYVIPQYENDVTHVLKQPRSWWEKKFENHGWEVTRFSYLIKGMKENWASYEKGNGFFFLNKK